MGKVCTGVLAVGILGALPWTVAAQQCAWTVQQVTSGPNGVGDSTISSDGRKVAVLRFGVNIVQTIDVATLAIEDQVSGWNPVLSAFESSADYGGNPDRDWEVFVADLATRQIAQVSNGTGNFSGLSTHISADGKHVVSLRSGRSGQSLRSHISVSITVSGRSGTVHFPDQESAAQLLPPHP